LGNQLLRHAQPIGTAAVCRGVEQPVDGVERQPVGCHWRETARSRNPGRATPYKDAKVGRDEEIARDRVVGDAGDRLVAEVSTVDIRPGRRVTHCIIMNIEHMPLLGRVVRIIARERDEGVVRVFRINRDPAHEPGRCRRSVDAVKRDARVRFIGIWRDEHASAP